MESTKIALIPAYEPDETFLPLVRRLTARDFTVVVVDDGSGPDYTALFDTLRPWASVLSYSPNQGKGHALKAGLSYIAANYPPESVIVTMDCDGQHTVSDADRAAARAFQTSNTLVLGVRSFGDNTPPRSKFGNSVTRAVYYLSTGVRVSDTQTGLRAFGMALVPPLLEIAGERYDYEMNTLLDLPGKGIPIAEVPIETIYLNNNRASHFKTFRDSALVYKNFLKFIGSSLTGFAVDYSLYSLLVTLFGGLGGAVIPLANVTARVVSAGTNFAINKHFVFKSNDSVLKTGAQYFALAACILAGNTLLLSVLVNTLGWNKFSAKLITEVTFFTLSFLSQRFWIFRAGRGPAASAHRPLKTEKQA